MLRTRVLTALILLVVFLGALFFLPPVGWVGVATVIAAVAAWEWGALVGLRGGSRVVFVAAIVLMCLAWVAIWPATVGLSTDQQDGSGLMAVLPHWIALAFWCIVVPLWFGRRWQVGGSSVGLLVGAIVLIPTWLALIQLRQAGELVLLGFMAIVWVADSGAYFFGRALGRHKLAPTISPGKTWEGAFGGALAVMVYGFACRQFASAYVTSPVWLFVLALVLYTVLSVMGDLFESLMKRQAGMKDSGTILPGHGGALDRIDSLTSTLPIAVLLLHLAQASF